MGKWKDTLIQKDATVRDAIEVIDNSKLKIALIVDDALKLVGLVTDGDIRRALLKGFSLDDAVVNAANKLPLVIGQDVDTTEALSIMRKNKLYHIPIVKEDGTLISLRFLDDLLQRKRRNNPVVLMAGGYGKRLQPLTDNCPKPLLKVGGKPILETIMENFISEGFYRFYISTFYKAEMIEEYFGNGEKWGIEIEYLREEKASGTAGALKLLPKDISESFFMMNGDLLTTLNVGHLLEFHKSHQQYLTVCVRKDHYKIPYGVVKVKESMIYELEEKPTIDYFINAGVYVMSPKILSMIPDNDTVQMTDLIQALMDSGRQPVAFPIREYWRDIGRFEDFEVASADYYSNFTD